MKNTSYLMLFLFVLACQISQSQTTVTGNVTDTNNAALPGANILEKGTTNGTQTDFDGNFSITIKDASATLIISYIGFASKEVSVDGQSTISVELEEDAAGLDEVVVVGYGGVKKSDLTGAVSSVKAEDLPEGSSPNVQSLLAGKVAGLTVNQNSAQPGGGFSVLIRGAGSVGAGNSPLYVIDGFPVTEGGTEAGGGTYNPGNRGSLNSLNTNDIESIEVLKDASATAIYGARAANGVVLITTKRGKSGVLNIDYTTSYALNNVEKDFDFLDARELMIEQNKNQNERRLFNNNVFPYGDVDIETLDPFVPPFSEADIAAAGAGTDWFDEITNVGSIQEHNISMSSGTDKSKYYLSFNYFDQAGIIKNTGLERYTGRINLDQEIREWLNFSVSFTISHIENQNSQLGGARNAQAGIIASAYIFPSFLPVKNEDGEFALNLNQPSTPNPVSLLDVDDQTKNNRILTNAKLEAQLLEGLNWTNSFGLDSKNAKRLTYLPKTTLYGNLANGRASQAENRDYSYLFESVLNYSKTLFSELDLNLLGGFSYQRFESEFFGADNEDFLTDLFLYDNLGAGVAERPGVTSGREASKLVSYFGRMNLNYLDRYLLTFTMRADGSDRFGANNQYGYFPSAAFGWKINQEPFMAGQEYLSQLKLRLSYGQTGNSNIGGNAFALYSPNSVYAFGNTINNGVSLSRLANPNLKWETTTEYNIGLDFGFFNNRLSGTFEYFNKEVSDLLSNTALPSFSPVSSFASNIGATESEGFEALVTSRNVANPNFSWNTSLTFGRFRDRWKERDPSVILEVYEGENDRLRNIYGFLSDGIVQIGEAAPQLPNAVPGDLNIRDVNGQDGEGNLTGVPDGQIDAADRVILGNEQPDFNYGIDNTFQVGNFDLNIYLYGEYGRDLFNATRELFTVVDVGNALEESKNRWGSFNTDCTLPSGLTTGFRGVSDVFIEDASFLRLRNITLGYRFPEIVNGIKSMRLFVDFQNLFVISDYKGGDPETDSFSAYPFPKTFKIGLNLNF
ncbi:MAG: TonB-dependent receptor [Pricia sp.]